MNKVKVKLKLLLWNFAFEVRGVNVGLNHIMLITVGMLVNLAILTPILWASLNHILSTGSANIWSALGLLVVLASLMPESKS